MSRIDHCAISARYLIILRYSDWFSFPRSSNGYSNESLESLNLSSEGDAESDREMDIEEEDEDDHQDLDDQDLEKKEEGEEEP